jgi:hypothetical protein
MHPTKCVKHTDSSPMLWKCIDEITQAGEVKNAFICVDGRDYFSLHVHVHRPVLFSEPAKLLQSQCTSSSPVKSVPGIHCFINSCKQLRLYHSISKTCTCSIIHKILDDFALNN